MHIGQTFQSCLMHSAHWLPSTTNRNWVARFPVTFKYLQIYTHIATCYFLKVNLLGIACFQYGYYFSLICSLLYVRAVHRSIQEQGLALRILPSNPHIQYIQTMTQIRKAWIRGNSWSDNHCSSAEASGVNLQQLWEAHRTLKWSGFQVLLVFNFSVLCWFSNLQRSYNDTTLSSVHNLPSC